MRGITIFIFFCLGKPRKLK